MELIARVEGGARRPHSAITGNDTSSRHNSQLIAESRMEGPFIWSVCWRTSSRAPARTVGTFRVDLRGLVDHGYAYQEDDGRVRLKVYHHDNGDLVVQRNLRSPGIVIARVV